MVHREFIAIDLVMIKYCYTYPLTRFIPDVTHPACAPVKGNPNDIRHLYERPIAPLYFSMDIIFDAMITPSGSQVTI